MRFLKLVKFFTFVDIKNYFLFRVLLIILSYVERNKNIAGSVRNIEKKINHELY